MDDIEELENKLKTSKDNIHLFKVIILLLLWLFNIINLSDCSFRIIKQKCKKSGFPMSKSRQTRTYANVKQPSVNSWEESYVHIILSFDRNKLFCCWRR